MDTQYTFHEAVNAIDRGTITGRVFPRSFRDNHPISQLLCIDWRSDADMRGWLDFFGAKVQGSVAWAEGWHGWSVLLTAHWSDVEDSGPVGIEQRGRHRADSEDSVVGAVTSAPSPAAVAVLAGDFRV